MRTTITYKNRTYQQSLIKRAELAVDTSLSGRVLDVDTARIDLSTGEKHLKFYDATPLRFLTRDRKQFVTTEDTALGAWDQASPLTLLRGGSQYAIAFPIAVTRTQANVYSFSLTSSLGRLTQLSHRGGIYTGAMTAGDLIREICGYNGTTPGPVTVYVAAAFENVAIYGWLPYVSPSGENGAQTGSAKDNLLQVLFAINAAVRDDASGVLRIDNLPTAVSSQLTADKIYRDNAQVLYDNPVTSVTVLEHQFYPGSETKKLFEGITTAGQVIVFSEPCGSLVATGFQITEFGANYAVVSAGSGTLTGVPYVDVTREITREVSNSDTPNPVRVEDATLVGVTAASDVVRRLAAYYACRTRINVDAVIEAEDAGDVVSIFDPFDRVQRSACIESISPVTVSNTMKGRVSALVDFTPWQTVPFSDERVVISQSGTYTFPNDIEPGTDVQAILIGGGQAGTNGVSGSSGSGSFKSGTIHGGETVSSPAGAGGSGGAGGVHGSGGRVYRVALTVDPGDSFAVTIGAGGASNGALGGATTFGSYSSANGESSDAGFYDATVSTTYGKAGVDGVAGAKGGNGGSGSGSSAEANRGANGSGVGSYSGGSGGAGFYFKGWLTTSVEGAGGGGGGGAAQGANGSSGAAGGGSPGGSGGSGGSGAAAALAEHYGDGGSGGNGGGGGGGGGGWRYSYDSSSPASTYSYAAYGGAGGAGSAGSAGAAGCVILIFRKPAQD